MSGGAITPSRLSHANFINIMDAYNPANRLPVLLIDYEVDGVSYQYQDIRGASALERNGSGQIGDIFDTLHKPNLEQGLLTAYHTGGSVYIRNMTGNDISFSKLRVTFMSLTSWFACAAHNDFNPSNYGGGTLLSGENGIEVYIDNGVKRVKGILGTYDNIDWNNLNYL